jgi:hypothetical protein
VETLLFRARKALRVELDDEAPRTRGRVLGGLLPFPGFGWDAYGSLVGWLAGRGATVKVAGAVSAAVLGTGVGVQQGLVPHGGSDSARASGASPVAVEHPAPVDAATSPSRTDAAPRARPAAKRAARPRVPAEKAQTGSRRPQTEATQEVAGALNALTTDVARRTAEVQREVTDAVTELESTAEQATGYIRKIPKVVSGIGALSAAEIPSAITLRVSIGSTIPSSQRRAVE